MIVPEISGESEDPEKAAILAARRIRPVALIAPVATGCAAATAIVLLSLGISEFVQLSRLIHQEHC
jgi:hypothetical protein